MNDTQSALAACRSAISQCKALALQGIGKTMEKLPREYDAAFQKFRDVFKSPRTRQLYEDIRHELAEAVEKLGGDGHLLAIIGTLGDTLTGEQTLAELKAWHHAHPKGTIAPARYPQEEPLESALTVATLKAKPGAESRGRRSDGRTQKRQAARRRGIAANQQMPRSRRQRTRHGGA
jgi:hypothetical protein